MGVELHLWLGSTASSHGDSLSPFLWLSSGVALGHGRMLSFAPFFGDGSCVQGLVQYHQKYFLLVSAET